MSPAVSGVRIITSIAPFSHVPKVRLDRFWFEALQTRVHDIDESLPVQRHVGRIAIDPRGDERVVRFACALIVDPKRRFRPSLYVRVVIACLISAVWPVKARFEI